MLKRLWKNTKDYFLPLKSDGHTPVLEIHNVDALREDFYVAPPALNTVEDVARRNQQKLEVAKLEQDRDAISKNLKAQHRLMIATLVAAAVALFSGVAAILIATHPNPPPVIVKLVQKK